MQKMTLFLTISLVSLCSIQGISAFSLSGFFSSCSSVFSRPKLTYDQNKSCDGLNSKQNIPHAIAATGVVAMPLFGLWWYRAKSLEKYKSTLKSKQALERQAKEISDGLWLECFKTGVEKCLQTRQRGHEVNTMCLIQPLPSIKKEEGRILAELAYRANEVKKRGLDKNEIVIKVHKGLNDDEELFQGHMKKAVDENQHIRENARDYLEAITKIRTAIKSVLASS